ncbi:MAG: VTT domain-containing protein [Alphaproteobacteria bacterium]|nr:VTT domain-containing protein [Alphaproteobacteria bacterium]
MKIKTWLIQNSSHPAALAAVFFLTLCESVFLFIPPEVFIAPPIVSDKKKAIPVVILASLGSLIGGAISYLIGMFLYNSIGIWLIENFSTPEKFQAAQGMFVVYGFLIIFIAAFTPVPFKLLAMAAGFVSFNPWLFLGISGIFRAARFAMVAAVVYKYQKGFRELLEKYFWWAVWLGIVVAILGAFVLSIM